MTVAADDCPNCFHSPYTHDYGFDKDTKGVQMWIRCRLQGCGCYFKEYKE